MSPLTFDRCRPIVAAQQAGEISSQEVLAPDQAADLSRLLRRTG
jgi:hypothetical protein